uniref:Uncharacterized protein n=1 Tax=Ditylenchus dipsaci TaxID=166011 RepID=A0A915DI06_9BILA
MDQFSNEFEKGLIDIVQVPNHWYPKNMTSSTLHTLNQIYLMIYANYFHENFKYFVYLPNKFTGLPDYILTMQNNLKEHSLKHKSWILYEFLNADSSKTTAVVFTKEQVSFFYMFALMFYKPDQ